MTTPAKGPSSPAPRTDTTTRVDTAHHPEALTNGGLDVGLEIGDAPLDLLQAIAGQDHDLAPQQMRSQALELATLLREKQQSLEHREAELNARTAQIENEIRSARLKARHDLAADHGWELFAASERDLSGPSDRSTPPSEWCSPSAFDSSADQDATCVADTPTLRQDLGHVDSAPLDSIAPPSPTAAGLDFDFQREYEDLQRERAELQEQARRHRERQLQLDQLHAEVLSVHQETLEMRLATEELWGLIQSQSSPEERDNHLQILRDRIAKHYRMANETLTRRKDEAAAERAELLRQEQRLRQQRRELQLWADRHYEDLESRTATLVAREKDLERLEAEFQSQILEWQQQRERYRRPLDPMGTTLREPASPPAPGRIR